MIIVLKIEMNEYILVEHPNGNQYKIYPMTDGEFHFQEMNL